MFAQLAQSTFEFDSNQLTAVEASRISAALGGILLVALIVALFLVICLWRVFEKAGVAGWKALIPVYNSYVMAEIAGKPGWWALVGLGGIIPVIGIPFSIASFILSVIISLELAKKFGKGTGFGVLLIFLPFIGYPILAFGDAKYTGAAPATPAAPMGSTPPSSSPMSSPITSPTSPTDAQPPQTPTPPVV